jgi:hypothetical protein
MTEELKPLHTPGLLHFVPWHIEEGSPVCRTDDGWILCTASSDAYAKRLAACWNACEGITDPSALRDMVEALKWIQNNPFAHRSNILCVVNDALAKLGRV